MQREKGNDVQHENRDSILLKNPEMGCPGLFYADTENFRDNVKRETVFVNDGCEQHEQQYEADINDRAPTKERCQGFNGNHYYLLVTNTLILPAPGI